MSTSEITYKIFEGYPKEEIIISLTKINQEVFGWEETQKALEKELEGRSNILICLAFQADTLVGFKLGFKERSYYFESWRGGVLQSYRNQGIGQELLRRQHEWCKTKGFRIVTTITDNKNIPMLMVNLRNGFEIVGTFFDRGQHVKIVLQKWLIPIPNKK